MLLRLPEFSDRPDFVPLVMAAAADQSKKPFSHPYRARAPKRRALAPKRSARAEAYWVAIFLFNRCASERVDGTVNLERCPSGKCGCSSKVFRETRSDFEPNPYFPENNGLLAARPQNHLLENIYVFALVS